VANFKTTGFRNSFFSAQDRDGTKSKFLYKKMVKTTGLLLTQTLGKRTSKYGHRKVLLDLFKNSKSNKNQSIPIKTAIFFSGGNNSYTVSFIIFAFIAAGKWEFLV
jgi:hypothetical protein